MNTFHTNNTNTHQHHYIQFYMFHWNSKTAKQDATIEDIIRGITWNPFLKPSDKTKTKKSEKIEKIKKIKKKHKFKPLNFNKSKKTKKIKKLSLDEEMIKRWPIDCFMYKDDCLSTREYHKKEERAKGAMRVGQYKLAKAFYIQAAMHRLWHSIKFCNKTEDWGHKLARISCLYQAKLIIEKFDM